MKINQTTTTRGFNLLEFTDLYENPCSIQQSSIIDTPAIWLGITDATPQIMAEKTPAGGVGWVPYEIPDDVLLTTRMYLTQEQVKALLPVLQQFADTGELIK